MKECSVENPLSYLESSFVVMPVDANHYGNVHGGVIMLYCDNLAYAVASKFSHMNVVTAKVSELNFLKPVKIGDLVIIKGSLIRVGNSSMEIKLCISGEHLLSGEVFDVAEALFTMIAVDESGRPKKIRR